MLDPLFKQIIDEVTQIMNAHRESQSKDIMFSRDWEFIFNEIDGWVILCCSTMTDIGDYWVYPELYPETKIDDLKKQLPSYSIVPAYVGYDHVMSGDDKHWIEPFWKNNEDLQSKNIPIFFKRIHYGRPKGKENYIEFNQLVTHPLNLHWSENKQALCSVDENGDEVEKVKYIKAEDISLILIRRKTLDKLLYLGDWVLVRYVHFSRREKDFYSYEGIKKKIIKPYEYEAKFELRYYELKYVEFRGVQIERPISDKKQLLNLWVDEENTDKQYCSFIIQDWKNKKLRKNYSLNPENFANYFTESDLPFETSPIYFKPEVLDKYKNNPDKYDLSERTISCRGGWNLQTYDINDYGQVHTYAIYLSRLPYKEQLHWLQYNEKPKGGLSKRAIRTDFEGEFPDCMSNLEELKAILEELGSLVIEEIDSTIWSPKGGSWENASKGLHLVTTENANQWHDFIIALTNTVNEGFKKKALQKLASVPVNEDSNLGRLGLLKYVLKQKGRDDLVEVIHSVLNELQKARSAGKAHGAWQTPDGSLINDSKERVAKVTNSLNELVKFIKTEY